MKLPDALAGKELLRINLYILLVWFSDFFVRKPRCISNDRNYSFY